LSTALTALLPALSRLLLPTLLTRLLLRLLLLLTRFGRRLAARRLDRPDWDCSSKNAFPVSPLPGEPIPQQRCSIRHPE